MLKKDSKRPGKKYCNFYLHVVNDKSTELIEFVFFLFFTSQRVIMSCYIENVSYIFH